MYQRWLYQHYSNLWGSQSEATKAEYRSAGSRFHLTGFQYWMKDTLTSNPDISAHYRLDSIGGSKLVDSGPDGHTGTNFGGALVDGRISNALQMDGINDYANLGNWLKLGKMSIMWWMKTSQVAGAGGIFGFRGAAWVALHRISATSLRLYLHDPNNRAHFDYDFTSKYDGRWHPWCLYLHGKKKADIAQARLYVDSTDYLQNTTVQTATPTPWTDVILGRSGYGTLNAAYDDLIIIPNRLVTAAEIAAFAERRYPL